MVDKPIRVQISRKKGWRMPANTVSVARPGKWGNPFPIADGRTAAQSVAAFREHMADIIEDYGNLRLLSDLHGKNLACWCALDAPCHADVLLELANAPLSETGDL